MERVLATYYKNLDVIPNKNCQAKRTMLKGRAYIKFQCTPRNDPE